jgi:hypothetical protein
VRGVSFWWGTQTSKSVAAKVAAATPATDMVLLIAGVFPEIPPGQNRVTPAWCPKHRSALEVYDLPRERSTGGESSAEQLPGA